MARPLWPEGSCACVQLVSDVLGKLEGAYGLLVKSAYYPGELVAAKLGSPLLLGIREVRVPQASPGPCHGPLIRLPHGFLCFPPDRLLFPSGLLFPSCHMAAGVTCWPHASTSCWGSRGGLTRSTACAPQP